ncbi:MAG: LmbE family N-acetylglucosaminyl deacetylase [Pirellulaceae bacterium]|jgi:LmbE family N-acetylglucosaminyl deacetylase
MSDANSEAPLRMMILGAHPDDAEFHAGGLACRYAELGHVVRMISVTDGGAGHHFRKPAELVATRRAEAAASGNVIQSTYETWDFPDGRLLPSLDLREKIIREIRDFSPDLVLTHRVNDYHPDHRAVGQVVQDASYMVTVPLVVPDVPIVEREPVVAYMPDLFTKPCPLVPDVVYDVTRHVPTVAKMLACHRSQVFEFLPFNQGIADQVPEDEAGKQEWIKEWYCDWIRPRADRFREQLIAAYGDRANEIEYVEAYEVSEYAGSTDAEGLKRLFPVEE